MNQQAEASSSTPSSRITPFISRTPKWPAKTAKQRQTRTVRFRRLKVVAEIDDTEEWRECHPEAETAIAREEFERRLDLLCSTNLERQQRIMTKRNTAKNGEVSQEGLLELYSVGRDSLGSLPVEDNGDLPSLHPRNLEVFTDVTYDLTERGGWVVNEQQERTALGILGRPSRYCEPEVLYGTNDEDAEIIDAPVSQFSGLDDGQAADALEPVTSELQRIWLTRPCATSMTARDCIHELGESEVWSDGKPTPDDDASIRSLREA